MLDPMMLGLGAFVLLLVIARRFIRPRQDFEAYRKQAQQTLAARMEALREENAVLDAEEALGPVLAGVRELLELHGSPDHIALTRGHDHFTLTRTEQAPMPAPNVPDAPMLPPLPLEPHSPLAPLAATGRATLPLRTFTQAVPLRVRVAWERRSVTLSAQAKHRHLTGRGHWAVTVDNLPPEPYAQLSVLMGRLSALLRTMRALS